MVARCSMFHRRALSVADLMVWNLLPNSLQDPTRSVDCFRQNLKTSLFSSHYTVSQKNDTHVAHYNFDADKPILIILAGNSYKLWATTSLFNFSCPFAITSLICRKIRKVEMTHLSLQSCCIVCLKNDTVLACYIFDIHQPVLIILCRQ